MPFLHMLPDVGMNYTFNRPLLDGTSPARLKELSAISPRIKDYDSWYTVWLEVAKKAEAEKRYLDAASYYHGAEFYLPAGDVRNALYDDFARNWALGMKGVADYERIEIPYPGGHLPGFRLQAKGKERSTFIFTGGYDSFVEEFYNFLLPLTELGITVIAFDGPGQGGALRQGIYMDHAWEKPAKAAIDYFKLDAVDWLGASCGGYMSIRAAAFEPRIKHIISMPTTYWGLDMTLRQMRPGKAQELISRFKAGDRKGTEAVVAEERLPSSVFEWCIVQGMHITGTKTPFDFLTEIAKHSLDGTKMLSAGRAFGFKRRKPYFPQVEAAIWARAGRPPAPGHRQLSQGQEAYEGLGERDRTARRQRSTPRALIRLPKGAGKIVQKLRLRHAESKGQALNLSSISARPWGVVLLGVNDWRARRWCFTTEVIEVSAAS
jgi:hypothetical protein